MANALSVAQLNAQTPSAVSGVPPVVEQPVSAPTRGFTDTSPAAQSTTSADDDADFQRRFGIAPPKAGAPTAGQSGDDDADFQARFGYDSSGSPVKKKGFSIEDVTALKPLTEAQRYSAEIGRESDAPTEQLSPFWADVRNITGNIVGGVPIVGPAAKDWLERAPDLSGARPSDDDIARIQSLDRQEAAKYPVGAGVGNAVGQIAGYTAIAAAFPELFGGGAIEGAPMATRMAASSAGNAILSGADAIARGEDPRSAAAIGGVLGAAAPPVSAALGRLFTSTVIPRVTQLAQRAINDFGIRLTPDMAVSNPMVKFASGVANAMPFGAKAAPQAANMDAFYRGIATELGEPAATRITGGADSVMANAKARIGGDYDNILAQSPSLPFNNFAPAYSQIANDITHPPSNITVSKKQAAAVNTLFDSITKAFKDGNGELTGDAYKALTQSDGELDRAIGSKDPVISQYATRIRQELGSAFQSNLSPDLADSLATADRQYWTMKTLEPIIERHVDGAFTPEEFAAAVRKNTNNYAYGGGGNLADLAQIGETFLKQAPNPKIDLPNVIRWAAKPLEIAGSLYGGAHFLGLGPVGAAAAVIPTVIGRAVSLLGNRTGMTNRLIQSALGQGAPSFFSQAAVPVARGAVPTLARGAVPLVSGARNMLFGAPASSPADASFPAQ